MINILDKFCREKVHILRLLTFSENRAVYEIMSKYLLEPERLQLATWRRVACRISKTVPAQARTHTHLPARAQTQICDAFAFLR
jgi:hypothetical protein